MKNYLIAWLPRWLQFNRVLFYKERNDANSVAEKNLITSVLLLLTPVYLIVFVMGNLVCKYPYFVTVINASSEISIQRKIDKLAQHFDVINEESHLSGFFSLTFRFHTKKNMLLYLKTK